MLMFKKTILFSSILAIMSLGGCASTGDPRDPIEPFNRAMYRFNEGVDDIAIKPMATGYRAAMPTPVQNGVRNFFSNLDDVAVMVNNLLQFKLEQGVSDFLRVAFNTTFGMFGFADVASEMGLRKHNEDFGQTLGRWGIGSGAYLVLPFFGPSSLRDGLGLAVDNRHTDLVQQVEHIPARNWTVLTRTVSKRADLLDATATVEAAALDDYEFTRDFYLERREGLVSDGKPHKADI
jgi:phospholipid-binding lipoprotein MlaA